MEQLLELEVVQLGERFGEQSTVVTDAVGPAFVAATLVQASYSNGPASCRQ